MLRKSSRLFYKRFQGLNSYIHPENIIPPWWSNSLNVAVSANGSAEVMRSPLGYNSSVGSTNPVISMADYLSPSTHKLVFDIEIPDSLESSESSAEPSDSDHNLATYTINDDFTNRLIRQDQFNAPFISAVVNNKLFRVNEAEFIQLQEDAVTFYRVGIDPPAAAPMISYSADSDSVSSTVDDLIADGIQFSYAYRNSVTGHVSKPSPISNRLTAGGDAISVPVTASTQFGVDGIVFFATEDGGAIPYLLIDSSGDVVIETNSTGTVVFDISDLIYDTLTPEPIFNDVPPLGAQFMFTWKDRVFLLNFVVGSDVGGAEMVYSGFESTYIGQPGESWPPLNRIGIPNKGERLRGGIGTQVGALVLSDLDAYLISGYPTDKTSGPEATTAVSEHLDPLHWNIGTQSPRSMRNTPFGTVWLDHAKRLRLWKGEGFPTEVGLPLRKELALLDSARLDECEGQWFQMGEAGGFYAMVGPTKDSSGQRLFLITLYQDPENPDNTHTGFAVSDIEGYSLQPVRVFDEILMFLGGIDKCFTILDSSQEGDGWPEDTTIFFEIVLGNNENFNYWHSIRFDGTIEGLTLTIRNPDETPIEGEVIEVSRDLDTGLSWYGLLDVYGRRKILRFAFDLTSNPESTLPLTLIYTGGSMFDTCTAVSIAPLVNSDSEPRQIKNLQVYFQDKKRNI